MMFDVEWDEESKRRFTLFVDNWGKSRPLGRGLFCFVGLQRYVY